MAWFSERFTMTSEKNGQIIATRLFKTWSIRVGGFDETTPYLRDMWRKAFTMLPRKFRPKRILMLGLGAGGEVQSVQEYFPKASITVIEWDAAMVELATRCALFVFNEKTQITIGDAANIVPTLTGKFDLILVDLFTGPEVSPTLADDSFAQHLARLIAPDGHLLANIFHSPERLVALDRFLGRQQLWRYQYNRMAFYRPHGCGTVGDPLPAGFISHKQSKLYADLNEHGETVGEYPCLGKRTQRGPIYFEHYTSDHEPTPEQRGGIGIITWQPLTRTDCPRLWRRRSRPFIQQTGFAEIKNPEKYWEPWTDHAKRHRSKWLRETPYAIERVSPDEFIGAYRRESNLPLTKYGFINVLKHDATHHGDRLVCLAARDTNGSLVAGLAVLDLPDANTSNHTISFIARRAKDTSVGTGLIDAWFQHAIKKNIRFLNFGVFAAPHDPASWRGFSKFKAQFGIHRIRYPRPLFKILW